LPHNSITNPVITLTHKSSGLDGGPAGGPDGGPDGGPAGGPDGGPEGGPDGGPEGGPAGGPDGGPEGGPAGGPDGGPEGGPDGGPDGGDGAADAGAEGTAGGPVGAGVEGTGGGPVGAGESIGAISVSAGTSVDDASDTKSTGAFVTASATTSSFCQDGVLTSFDGWLRDAVSGSEREVSGLDFSQGGVRGASSSSSISAAAPTFIFVAPPSAFSPWYVVRTTELESIISFSSVFPNSLRCSVNAPTNKLLPIALFNLRPFSS